MIRRMYYIACDSCLDIYGGTEQMGDTAEECRSMAARDGWACKSGAEPRQRRIDLCPKCLADGVTA